jgi:hypothetical protein
MISLQILEEPIAHDFFLITRAKNLMLLNPDYIGFDCRSEQRASVHFNLYELYIELLILNLPALKKPILFDSIQHRSQRTAKKPA